MNPIGLKNHILYAVSFIRQYCECIASDVGFGAVLIQNSSVEQYLAKSKRVPGYSCVPNTSPSTLKLFSSVFPPVRGLFSTARLLFVKEFSPRHD